MNYAPISEKEERIARAIVDAAYAVHSALGPGLLENVYEVDFIDILQQARAKGTVNSIGGVHNCAGDALFFLGNGGIVHFSPPLCLRVLVVN